MIISNAWSYGILILAGCTKAIAQGMSQPALQTEALRSVPSEKRGLASSTMYIGGDLGQAVGPILAVLWQSGLDMELCIFSVQFRLLWHGRNFVLRERKLKRANGIING